MKDFYEVLEVYLIEIDLMNSAKIRNHRVVVWTV